MHRGPLRASAVEQRGALSRWGRSHPDDTGRAGAVGDNYRTADVGGAGWLGHRSSGHQLFRPAFSGLGRTDQWVRGTTVS